MHIITFDIEDWFHFLEHSSTKDESDWKKFESRIVQNLERILDLLEEKNLKATFFILGWIAEKNPTLVKMIEKAGHEIGLHSYSHQLIWQQSPKTFAHDLERNINVIEDITGQKITIYRAPGFSIKKKNAWAIEVLVSHGITTDASIFPAFHAHGGIPDFPVNEPCRVSYNGSVIKEFPMSFTKVCGLHLAFSGGGFFRFWPYPVLRHFTKKSSYLMSYFHPRDFDIEQPVMSDLSAVRKFRAYYGLNGSFEKFTRWTNEFDFIDLRTADKMIDWEKARIFNF